MTSFFVQLTVVCPIVDVIDSDLNLIRFNLTGKEIWSRIVTWCFELDRYVKLIRN